MTMKFRRRLGLAAVVVMTTTAIGGGASAAAASRDSGDALAISCSGWRHEGEYEGVDYTLRGQDTPVRPGPYAKCGGVLVVSETRVETDCYIVNEYGNTWTYVRYWNVVGYDYGWIYDGNLQGNGSSERCPS
ncbi:hypothetical protein AB0425_04220 [Actinosynnema sp. NPDC051121]